MTHETKRSVRKADLKISTSAFVLAMLAAPVAAQDTEESGVEEIIISTSRIQKSGFEAPTPVTTLGSEDLAVRGSTNVADLINELPGFAGTSTPTSTTLSSRGSGVNALDLRGLGTNRNLVLVNGRRHVPADEFGIVDLNVIPSLAIRRVEVVTGGASAAWGSDAVSGVVNVIYDKELEGLKAETQFGVSGRGDAEAYRVAVAYGSRTADDRGHFLIAAEYNENGGIPDSLGRDWQLRRPGFLSNPADTGPNDGIPSFQIVDNVRLFLASPNGITFPGGPLGNLEFQPDGTATQRELGVIGGNLMIGGSGSALQDATALLVATERKSLLAAFDYDLSDDINFYFEGSASQSNTSGALIHAFVFGQPINSGNPFLPASVQQTIDDTGTGSLALWRTTDDFNRPITSVSETNNLRFVGGFTGDFSNGWTWDVYYQYGKVDFQNTQENNLIPGNLQNAADAVLDPVSGEIVCASGAPGCVPINLFGFGSPSEAAIDYVTGNSISNTTLTQQVVSASVNGDVFDGWAGPISAAFGAEYRAEDLDRQVDALSDNAAFLITNAQPLQGNIEVADVFGEVLVPLLDDDNLGSMAFNGAARLTDYSTSGTVVTWKLGLTYDPIEELRLRGSVSRDIRAPAIGEFFLETLLLFDNIQNPFTGTTDLSTINNTGNDNLQEERSTTTTFGVIYSPNWLEGLRLSVDWYNIDISGAIASIDNQAIVDRCFAGESDLCDLIDFAPDQTITNLTNTLLNLGTFKVEGIDFQANYSTQFDNGDLLGVNVFGSYLYTRDVATDGINIRSFAGEVGPGGFGMPELKVRSSVNYATDAWNFYGQVRFIGASRYNTSFGPEQLAPEQNKIGSESYVDLSVTYKIDTGNGPDLEVYGGINNLLDNDPPVLPEDFIGPRATNPIHYDVIGRYFFAGLRAQF